MKTKCVLIAIFSAGVAALCAGPVCSQVYPNKPVRIVTSAAGGGADFVARLIAQGLAVSLGEQVIVDNRAAGVISIEVAAKAPPDGYMLLLNSSTIWLLPYLRDHVPWDPLRDFSPITMATTAPAILVVHPSLLVNSVKDLLALAKAKPGELNYSTSGTGNTNHMAAELFKSMGGINIVRINYKSTATALTDLIGGRVQMMFPNAAGLAPHVKAGRLRALAVTSAQPSALFPELPTISATGLPGYESVSPYGIFAPAKTPAAIIARLNQDIVRILSKPELKESFLNAGVEPVGGSPVQLTEAMKADMARMGKVIKEAGIRDE